MTSTSQAYRPNYINRFWSMLVLNLMLKSSLIKWNILTSTRPNHIYILIHSFIGHVSLLSVPQDYEYPNHAQSTQHQKNDRCPPPPQMLPERACEVPGCRSDSECERHKRCCYNGCIYACLESVQPPPGQQHQQADGYTHKLGLKLPGNLPFFLFLPLKYCCCGCVYCTVLDWLVQPKPRWLGGNGWLLDGPEEVLQGEYTHTHTHTPDQSLMVRDAKC